MKKFPLVARVEGHTIHSQELAKKFGIASAVPEGFYTLHPVWAECKPNIPLKAGVHRWGTIPSKGRMLTLCEVSE